MQIDGSTWQKKPFSMRAFITSALVCVIMSFLVGLQIVVPTSIARAAENGSVSNLELSPNQLQNGATGNLRFDWGFPAGTNTGDTLTLTAASDFALSAPAAFPNGQPILGPNDVLLATLTVSGNVITITREVGSSWGAITSEESPAVPFLYSGNIAPSEDRTTSWPSTSGSITANISGVVPSPAWYGPRKQGTFTFNAVGEPIILWAFYSPIGLQPAASVNLRDVVGPGHELLCDSITGSIGRWDQSYPNGSYTYLSSLSWAPNSFECSPAGFTATIDQEIPAPLPGENTSLAPDNRPDNVAYAHVTYTTRVTDITLATTGWANTMNWEPPSVSQPFASTVRFPGTASGNRVLTVTKTAIGPETKYNGEQFEIIVDCTVSGQSSSGFPITLSLEANTSEVTYAPIGSTCVATEPDSKGADSNISEPVAITSELETTFSLGVENDFSEFEVSPVVPNIQQSACTVPGQKSSPRVTTAENTDRVTYVVTGNKIPGGSVTVTATLADEFAWSKTLPEGWIAQDNGTAAFSFTLNNPDCPQVAPSQTSTGGSNTGLSVTGSTDPLFPLGIAAGVMLIIASITLYLARRKTSASRSRESR